MFTLFDYQSFTSEFCVKIKITMKRLILSDESLNSHGFWVKTPGIDMTRFQKNPVMLFNHHRTTNGKKDEILPIGRWEDLRIENGVLTGTPVFDEKDEFALKIKNKVEDGFLSGCSIGITVKEWSEKAEDLKPGQQYPTVTVCELMEVSIVDIPSNPNSAGGVVLYDNDDNVITLADGRLPEGIFNKPKTLSMNKDLALKLGLSETATVEECCAAIDRLNAKDAEIQTLKSEKANLENEVKTLKAEKMAEKKDEAEKLVDEAVRDGRIDAKAKERFEKLFESDFDNAKVILESIPKRTPMSTSVVPEGSGKFEKMSWDELDKQELLAELKVKDPALYEKKYNEKFNKQN